MEKVRLGVIGTGTIGKVHAETLSKIENCDLVAICDVDEKFKKLAETLRAKYFTGYQEMIEKEKLDGVVIATPNNLHTSQGIECAKKGIHLLVEKPITLTVADADDLIEAASKYNIQILVGQHRRFSPFVEATRDAVRGGQIGTFIGATILFTTLKPPSYFAAWKGGLKEGGGPIFNNLIHEVDTLRWIFGEVTRVYSEVSSKGRNLQVEDTASITLRMADDALVSILLSDCVPANTSYEACVAENPDYFRSSANCYYFFGTKGSITFPQMNKLHYPDGSKLGWHTPISEENIKVVSGDPIERELRHFCKVVSGEESPRISGGEGRRTLEVILAIKESAETGQPISLQ